MKNENGDLVPWHTPSHLWEKLRPEARRMRHEPTLSEEHLWEQLRNRKLQNYRFRRQHAIDRFIVDFFCSEARLVIEVDGVIHEANRENDKARDEILESLGFRVLRFTNDEVDNNMDEVLRKIAELLLYNNETR